MKQTIKAAPFYYEQVILKFIDPNSIRNLYDIGVGPKSEYKTIINKYPDINFFGIEAHPDTYNSIKSEFPGELLNMAISESGGGSEVQFVEHEVNVMASGLLPYDNAKDGRRISIPSITLDEFDQKFDKREDVLLWMDIEGYELIALKSGNELLSSGRVKLLNLEVRPRWNNKSSGCTEAEIDDHLAHYGYKKLFVYNHYSSSRHHDAIYVSNDYTIPSYGTSYIELYKLVTENLGHPDGLVDLALGAIDLSIACEEREDKIRYLRSKLASDSSAEPDSMMSDKS